MDDGGHREKGGHRVDYYKGVHPQVKCLKYPSNITLPFFEK